MARIKLAAALFLLALLNPKEMSIFFKVYEKYRQEKDNG